MAKMRWIGFLVAMSVMACGGGTHEVECETSADCSLGTGGSCDTNAPTGRKWCSYPAPECDSGRRWSDFETGDGLSGNCVVADLVVDGGVPDAMLPDAPFIDAGVPDARIPDARLADASPPPDAGWTWSTPTLAFLAPGGESWRFPNMSADELELYVYRPGIAATDGFYVATRSVVTASFGAFTHDPSLGVPDSFGGYEDPELSPNRLQMLTVARATGPGLGGTIQYFVRGTTDAAWTASGTIGSGISPTLSGDGLSLYYLVADTGGGQSSLKKRTRSTLLASFGAEQTIGFTPPGGPYMHIDISSDELRILVSSDAVDSQGVLIGSRGSVGASFTSFESLPQLEIEDEQLDATWNSDETKMWLTIRTGGQYHIGVSTFP